MKNQDENRSEIVLYQTEDGVSRIHVRFEDETVWLTQLQIAELFQTTKQNISLHIQNIFDDGELLPGATVKEYLTVQTEGGRRVQRALDHYNLEMILAIGYRVHSPQGTRFRIWATERLRDYLVKGFAMDDERLKEGRLDCWESRSLRDRDFETASVSTNPDSTQAGDGIVFRNNLTQTGGCSTM